MTAKPTTIAIRTAAGAIVLIASRLIARIIDLLALILLGRLLSPADFGLVAIAMSVMMIVEATTEVPISMALLAFPTRSKAHYDTAFTLMLMRGVILTLVLLIVAWPLSYVYSDHRLFWLIIALGIAPVARSLASPRIADFSTQFDFRPSFIMVVVGKLVSLVSSISVAYWTRSYWSLAVGTIAAPITVSILSYFFAPYRPAGSLKEWRGFSGYVGWSTATQAILALNWQMDQLLLGRFVTRYELGRFSMASNLSSIPWQMLVVQITSPLLVAFSRVRTESNRLKAAYQKSANTVITIGLPIMVGLSINAHPIVRLILDDQWKDSGSMLVWLALVTIPSMFASPLSPLSLTLNRMHIFFWLALIESAVKLPATLVAIYMYGIPGVLFVRLVSSVILSLCSMVAARDLVGIPVWQQIIGPWRAFLSALIMVLAIVPLEARLETAEPFTSTLVGLLLVVVTGAIVYIVSMFLLWRVAGSPDSFEATFFKPLSGYVRRILK